MLVCGRRLLYGASGRLRGLAGCEDFDQVARVTVRHRGQVIGVAGQIYTPGASSGGCRFRDRV